MSNPFVPNGFQVSNDFVDLAMVNLSANAVKCYLFLLRRIGYLWGEKHQIPISEIQHCCQIEKEETVQKALKQLIKAGLIARDEPDVYFLVSSAQ